MSILIRRQRAYFFATGTSDRFKANDYPTMETFAGFINSVPFIADVNDTATVIAAGHIRLENDTDAIIRTLPIEGEHSKSILAYHLPNLFAEELSGMTDENGLAYTNPSYDPLYSEGRGIKVKYVRNELTATQKRRDFVIENTLEFETDYPTLFEITETVPGTIKINPGTNFPDAGFISSNGFTWKELYATNIQYSKGDVVTLGNTVYIYKYNTPYTTGSQYAPDQVAGATYWDIMIKGPDTGQTNSDFDSSWISMSNMSYLTGVVQYVPAYRIINRLISFRGRIIVPLDNGSGTFVSDLSTYPDTAEVAPYVGAVTANAVTINGNRIYFCAGSGSNITNVDHRPEKEYYLGETTATRIVTSKTDGSTTIPIIYTTILKCYIDSVGRFSIEPKVGASDNQSPYRKLISVVREDKRLEDYEQYYSDCEITGEQNSEVVAGTHTHAVSIDGRDVNTLGGFIIDIEGLGHGFISITKSLNLIHPNAITGDLIVRLNSGTAESATLLGDLTQQTISLRR